MQPGTRIAARYEIVREDGDGPAMRAFRALDHDVEVEVAIWVVRPELLEDDGDRRVFCADALRARAVSHPHLRRLFDAGVHGGTCYLTLQPLDGPTLAALLATGATWADAELARIGSALAEALAAGHAGNLVHGRLSPGEVVLVEGTPKLGGMGLWRALDPNGAATAFAAAAAYLAPEVRAGEGPTARSDVYSLAATLAGLAMGGPPPVRDVVAALARTRPALADALAPALAEDPEARPASTTAAMAALTALTAQGAGGHALPPAALAAPLAPTPAPEEEAPTQHYLSLADAPDDPEFPTDELAAAPSAAPPAPAPRPRARTLPPALLVSAPSVEIEDDDEGLAGPTQRDLRPVPARMPVPVPMPAPMPASMPMPAPTATAAGSAVTAPPAAPVRSRPLTAEPYPSAPRPPPRRIAQFALLGALLLLVGAGLTWFVVALTRKASPRAEAPAAVAARPQAVDGGVIAMPVVTGLPDSSHSLSCPHGARLVAEAASFCIDVYEAPGEGFTPVANVTFAQARDACAARKKRLCTGAEWERACRGPGGQSYPYGNAFVGAHCNVRGGARAALAPAGSFKECRSAAGLHDMSGNVAEWVEDGVTRGGSAGDNDDGRCSHVERRRADYASADVGYRCCATPGAF